jgi:hypothetical protein
MDHKRTALERAFDLARSGACSSTGDLLHCLKLEGYSLTHIVGPSLLKQLRVLISEAQAQQSTADSEAGKHSNDGSA